MAKRWWAQKYSHSSRPFLEMSLSEILIEMYEDMMATRDEITYELKHGKGDKPFLYDQLAKVNEALADERDKGKFSSDPLIDKWERELDEGIDPDLDERWVG